MSRNWISATQAAAILDLDRSRVKLLCAQRRIRGAVKVGRTWCVPSPPVVLPPTAKRLVGKQKSKRFNKASDLIKQAI